MVAVYADEATVQAAVGAVGGAVGVAAVNGPGSVVVSGAAAAVGVVVERLTAAGVRSQGLRVSHAFHSALMEPMLGAFGTAAEGVEHRAPRGRWVSTVTGREVEAGEVTGAYWGRQVREPVRFAAALATARQLGPTVFVEAGPHPVLTALGQSWLADAAWVPSLRRGHGDRMQMLEALAGLYVHGGPIDWSAVHPTPARRRVSLPTYPWQRKDHWLDGVQIARREVSSEVKPEITSGAPAEDASRSGEIARRLVEARVADRGALALDYVAQQVATVLRVSRPESLDPRQRLMDMGLDSLMALDLRGRLGVGLGRPEAVPATLIFEHPTIESIAAFVIREAGAAPDSPEAPRHDDRTEPTFEETAARIAHLSEDEVEALLLKKLETL
jgi:polyketide synthase 12/polyene macrolide polyketide synthase/epothilone polyketide synthase D